MSAIASKGDDGVGKSRAGQSSSAPTVLASILTLMCRRRSEQQPLLAQVRVSEALPATLLLEQQATTTTQSKDGTWTSLEVRTSIPRRFSRAELLSSPHVRFGRCRYARTIDVAAR